MTDERFMMEALRLAEQGGEAGEVPVGAVIVKDGTILARAHNQVETLRDATAHAEMIVITQAAEALENWRLAGTEIFVTLEPCAMCAGALVLSRVARIVYAASDAAAGACGSVFDVPGDRIAVIGGLLGERSSHLLKSFFRSRRGKLSH